LSFLETNNHNNSARVFAARTRGATMVGAMPACAVIQSKWERGDKQAACMLPIFSSAFLVAARIIWNVDLLHV